MKISKIYIEEKYNFPYTIHIVNGKCSLDNPQNGFSSERGFNLSAEFNVTSKDGQPVDDLFNRLKELSIRRRKLAMYAVTHGYIVCIKAVTNSGKPFMLVINKPSGVRRLFYKLHSFPAFCAINRKNEFISFYRILKMKKNK